jgi:hypothetical protein
MPVMPQSFALKEEFGMGLWKDSKIKAAFSGFWLSHYHIHLHNCSRFFVH